MNVHRILPPLAAIMIGLVISLPAVGQQTKPRFFSDQTGKFRIRAEIVDLNETHVKLKKIDGDEVTLPINKLSDQDQTFLRDAYENYKRMAGDFPVASSNVPAEGAMVPRDESAGSGEGQLDISTLPQLVLEDLSDRPVSFVQKSMNTRRFTTASGASNWKVPVSRFAELKAQSEVTIALPNRVRPRHEGFWPSPNGQRALLLRNQELYALDILSGEVAWRLPSLPSSAEWKLHPLAISDDGSRLAFAVTDLRDEPRGMVAYDVEGLQARGIWQWRIVPESHKVPPVRAAYWLSNDRLGVLDDDGFTVWKPESQSAHAILKLDAESLPQLSPGAPMMGMLWMGRLALYRTDTMQPVAYSSHLPRGSRWISFRPDGTEIVVSGAEKAAVISTATGAIQEIDNEALANTHVEWMVGDRWLVDGEKVFNRTENEIDWSIASSSTTAGQGFAVMLGSQVAIADPMGARYVMRDPNKLIGAAKPEDALAAGMAVSAGSKVAVRLVGNQAEIFRDQMDSSVRSLIKRNGWVLDADSSTVLEVHANLQDQSVAYEMFGLTGKSTETVNVPVYRFEIRVVQGTKILDARGWSSLPKSIGKVPRGKTLAQHVQSLSLPEPERLATLRLPANIEKSKSTRGGRGTTEVWSIP